MFQLVQRASEGIKKGEGTTHAKAVDNVIKFLSKRDCEVYRGWYEFWSQKFVRENKWKKEPGHEYDIVARRLIEGVPFGKQYFIEVDGEKHSNTEPQINDGMAEKWVTEELKQKIIRLPKRECLGTPEDRTSYFEEKLCDLI